MYFGPVAAWGFGLLYYLPPLSRAGARPTKRRKSRA